MGTATIALQYVSQSAQEEAAVGALATLSLLSAAQWLRTTEIRAAFVAGLVAGAALLFRLNAVFALLPLTGCLGDGLLQRRISPSHAVRGVSFVLLGMLVPLSIHALFAYWRFGSVLSLGYGIALDALPSASSAAWWGNVRPKVAAGLLLGFGKGFFVLSPPLLLGFVGFKQQWRARPLLFASVVLALVCSALFHSKLEFPEGGVNWGARYQVHLVGFFVFPMMVGIRWLWTRGAGRRAVGLLVSAGILIQLLALCAPDLLEYAQVDAEGGGDARVAELTSGIRDGHLGRRSENVARWVAGQTLGSREISDTAALVDVRRIRDRYMPNLWGPAFAKYTGDRRASAAFLLAWAVSALVAAYWLTECIRYLARPDPDADGR